MKKYFLPNHSIEYFVFTDGKLDNIDENVHIIHQKKLGWPHDTLMRFHMFSSAKNLLCKCDYLFFINANLIINVPIDEQILPMEENYMGVLHPGFFNKRRSRFTYETRRQSTAFIPFFKGKHYFMGGFNGGKAEYFIKMSETLMKNIEQDLKNGIIAIWHDESHLNRYFWEHRKEVKILNPEYGYPEGWNLPFEAKITILDKSKHGGYDFLRS